MAFIYQAAIIEVIKITTPNTKRLQVKHKISEVGTEFFKSVGDVDDQLMNIAGEFMALNVEYVLNHIDEDETNKTVDILRNGFTQNQKAFLKRLCDKLTLKIHNPVTSKDYNVTQQSSKKSNATEITGLYK